MATAPLLRTGISGLDPLLAIGGAGLVTLRSAQDWKLSRLASSILARSMGEGRRALYIYWVEYHYRYWALDYDYLFSTAKAVGISPDEISDNVFFQRYFCKDNIAAQENWDKLFEYQRGSFDIIILDSVSELYDHAPKKEANDKPFAYSMGKFSELLSKQGAIGIALDYSKYPVHEYLGEISSIVLELSWQDCLRASITKHPLLAMTTVDIPLKAQQTLGRWSR